MTTISAHHLELLKAEVLVKAGLSRINPGDCRVVCFVIEQKTKHRISETTIKRMYGFAFSKYQPSMFTLDAMAIFCGYQGWQHWQEREQPAATNAGEVTWRGLKKQADRITEYTLQSLRNRSGIPYQHTVDRQFINRHMDEFLQSDSAGTIIAAPAGYGKTIATCRWVEHQIKNHDDNIYLFFSCTALISTYLSGRNMHDWLQGLLGYGQGKDAIALSDINDRNNGTFYLIIDGFDEHWFKPEHFKVLIDQLMDVFFIYRESSFFKMIVSMRTATWESYRHDLLTGSSNWYTGFKNGDNCINVPLLNSYEIGTLSSHINPAMKESVSIAVADSFGHPLYFEFYYREHKEDFSFKHIDHTLMFEISALFILNKVQLGKYVDEKIMLTRELVNKMVLSGSEEGTDKQDLLPLIKLHEPAYRQLLGVGFLREINEVVGYAARNMVRFGNIHFASHSIARTWLYENQERFDNNIIARINNELNSPELKLPVAKWCIIHAIRTGQQDSFSRIPSLELDTNQKLELVNFLGDLLRNEFKLIDKSEMLVNYFNQPFSKQMFEYFFGLELINAEYQNALNTLLLFNLPHRKRILVYTALGIIGIMGLDLDAVENSIEKMRAIPADVFAEFPFSPLSALRALHSYFKYGIVNREALVELTRLAGRPHEYYNELEHSASNDMLCLLACYTGYLFNNPRKLMRVVKKINGSYCNANGQRNDETYTFFSKILQADAYFRFGNAEEVTAIYQWLEEKYAYELLTPFMRILLACMKIKMLVINGHENQIMPEFRYVEAITIGSGSKLSKLYTLALLLRNEAFMQGQPDIKKQFQYDIRRITREHGLQQEIFWREPATA
ncbi:hypothetical protein FPZ43_11685 [Mucilaginibacter pallidiroseus]|uniref:Uncharacterized protein n=1 Tax=Mucilaginibacter pallidiroseus TaxID=2599295 RepID=A0A563UC69_9SPHI|nr:hypothetical protein [Mucilaginibacter pallidiroseus]TWR28920.1 hypothetical protein FPZ43_11685 [Mucilaginibacter pallidiroseus]